MLLQRRGESGAEIPVVVDANQVARDLRPLTPDIDRNFWEQGGVTLVSEALRQDRLPEIDVANLRFGPPVARPGALICIGQNYAAHAAESGAEPPSQPLVFLKHPNTIVGAYDEVILPPQSRKTDWELELVVVIGTTARYLPSAAAALDYVAGYTIGDEVSEREYQLELSGGQWSKGKCAETFNPLGPSLVTSDEIADPQNLALASWVNGEVRQNSNTSDMIFSVAQLIYELSQFMTLDPGDLVSTGTPAGVALSGRFPYLQVGDEVRTSIAGLGEQRHRIVAATGVPAGAGAAQIVR